MELAFALAAFVGSHLAISWAGLKPALQRRIGEAGYLAVYSALSVALLAWVIVALLRAPRTPLWATPDWAHGFAVIVSLLAFLLLGAGIATPNPLSAAFRRTPYNPARPGLVGWVRHPVISAFGLWGVAHVPANGEWPALALFAGSTLFAWIGARALEARGCRSRTSAETAALTPGSGHLTLGAALGAGFGGLAWTAVLAAHPALFGADPLGPLRALLP